MRRNIKMGWAGALLFIIAARMTAGAAETNVPSIIPLPMKIERREGTFHVRTEKRFLGMRLRAGTKIVTDAASHDEGMYLADRLREAMGYACAVETSMNSEPVNNAIVLTTQNVSSSLGEEGYDLEATPHGVVIRAPNCAGVFYGVQSLLQLLPPEALASKPVHGVKWVVPCVKIEDQPRFAWRGLMLDVSRHFFGKEEVKAVLDAMALHKLNRFHWHLTDDQGWRIEIKSHPKLTELGAWRSGINFKLDPKQSTAYRADGKYGGYYTQDDIREVVAYAQARHIMVIPEIEMPGHASAALTAYPEYSCTGGPFNTDMNGGIFNGTYCAGNDEVYKFLEDVLTEVFDLFPGKYIHIGGDEVKWDNWDHCAKCQELMKREGLQVSQVESYFIRRMEKFINSRGKTLIGWSEIRLGGLAQSAVVMDWIGGAAEAASAGHDVIMSPTGYCYLDHYQNTNHAKEPRAIGGYLPLSKVYSFEPIPARMKPADAPHVLGAQGNLWTEYVPSLKHAEYMIFPREAAMAEVVWSPKEARNWEDFQRRLAVDCRRLDQMGVNYRPETLSEPPASAARK